MCADITKTDLIWGTTVDLSDFYLHRLIFGEFNTNMYLTFGCYSLLCTTSSVQCISPSSFTMIFTDICLFFTLNTFYFCCQVLNWQYSISKRSKILQLPRSKTHIYTWSIIRGNAPQAAETYHCLKLDRWSCSITRSLNPVVSPMLAKPLLKAALVKCLLFM